MVADDSLRFDEIGYWSEIKLDILSKYAPAYTTIMAKQPSIRGYYYIDGFAGYGIHKSKTRDELIPGSPSIALAVEPHFTGYHFVDLNGKKIEYLKQLASKHSNVSIYEGDCNEILLDKIFPVVRYDQYKRALCLLDPYGLDLSWNVISNAGKARSIEIFLNFPVMDMNRNALWKSPDKVSPAQANRMTFFWGDETWRDAAYRKEQGLFEKIEEKTSNEHVALAFAKRLHEVAGFKYVPKPMPMRNSRGAIVYYFFFASQNETGGKIVKEIMSKYENRGA